MAVLLLCQQREHAVQPAPGLWNGRRGGGGVDFRILGMRKYAGCSCNRKVAIRWRDADIDLCPRCLRSGRSVVVEQNDRAAG